MTGDPIAYTYEADHHCPDCARKAFGQDDLGFVPETATDSEGNSIGAVAPWNVGEGSQTLTCSDCGAVLDSYEDEGDTFEFAERTLGMECNE